MNWTSTAKLLRYFWAHLFHFPTRTLYFGKYRLDKESRRLIIERWEREHGGIEK